ncbi:MAG: polysaccharide deacetylase family protein [Robiginitomaculum sp.]
MSTIQPYEPPRSIGAKIARRLLPYQARRLLKINLERPVISFTFDDFPRSALDNGVRILEANNWRATFYVSAGLMGVTNHHGQNFLAEDLINIEARNHEIAGHTFSHLDCTSISVEDVLHEVESNKEALQTMGVRGDIEHFAYPYGAASPALKTALAQKFKTMRGIDAGVHTKSADLNGLRSMGLFSGAPLREAIQAIERLKTQPGWLTLFAHDICDSPSKWGCSPAEFKQTVDAAYKSGAHVLPIGKALNLLEAEYG